MKYCPDCKRVYSDRKKFCDEHKTKKLETITENIEVKCEDCNSKEVYAYSPGWIFEATGHEFKGRFRCEKHEKAYQQRMREYDIMKYLVLYTEDDEMNMFNDSSDAEDYIKNQLNEYCFDDAETAAKSYIILQVLPVDGEITKEMFIGGNASMLLYEDEWYRVRSATNPSISFDGSTEVSID